MLYPFFRFRLCLNGGERDEDKAVIQNVSIKELVKQAKEANEDIVDMLKNSDIQIMEVAL